MRPTPKRRQWLAALILAVLLAACDMVAVPAPPADELAAPTITAPTSSAQAPAANRAAAYAARPGSAPWRAMHERENGDYDAVGLDSARCWMHTPTRRRPARRVLPGRSYALRGRWTSAVEALRGLLSAGPQPTAPGTADDLYARALFLTARGHEEAGAWADAVATYERYRVLKTVLEPYARLREAAQLRALGRPCARRLKAKRAVAAGDITRGERAGAYEKSYRAAPTARPERYRAPALPQAARSPDASRARLGRAAGVIARASSRQPPRWRHSSARTTSPTSWWRKIPEPFPAPAEALVGHAARGALRGRWEPEVTGRSSLRTNYGQRHCRASTRRSPLVGGGCAGAASAAGAGAAPGGDFAGALAGLPRSAPSRTNSPAGRQAQLDWFRPREERRHRQRDRGLSRVSEADAADSARPRRCAPRRC